MFATRPLDEDAHMRALDEARFVAAESGRATVIEAGRRTAVDWLARVHSQQLHPEWLTPGMGRGLAWVPDMVRLRTSLADAVTGIVLIDLLDDEVVDELLGPWASLVEEP
jgi:hypothetical protein